MIPRSRLTMLAVFAFPIFLVLHAAILSAQKLGPKSEPAEMSQDYNPLLWHGTEAEFALDTIHDSYCQAALSQAVLQKSANAQVKDLANTLAREQGALNRKLKQMAKTINFHIPHNEKSLAACPDASEIAGHSPVEIDKAYLSFLSWPNKIQFTFPASRQNATNPTGLKITTFDLLQRRHCQYWKNKEK